MRGIGRPSNEGSAADGRHVPAEGLLRDGARGGDARFRRRSTASNATGPRGGSTGTTAGATASTPTANTRPPRATSDPNEERGPDRYGDVDRRPAREPGRPSGFERPREVVARLDREPGRGPVGAGAGIGVGAVRGRTGHRRRLPARPRPAGALTARRPPARAGSSRTRRLPERPATVMGPRLGGAAALSRITTLQPASYNEARTIGERYRDGVPVIMNLTELDDAAAKRLVDFAAGLAFALRGVDRQGHQPGVPADARGHRGLRGRRAPARRARLSPPGS